MARLVRVAVPAPLRELLTYRVPEGWRHPPCGGRVVVPLGARVVTGCVVERDTVDTTTGPKLRDLLEAVDDRPLVPAEVLRLALWASDYYLCGPGEVLSVCLPPVAAQGDGREVRLTVTGLASLDAGSPPGRPGQVVRALQAGRARSREGLLRQLEREESGPRGPGRRSGAGRKPRRAVWTTALAAVVAAGLVEVVQAPVPATLGFHTAPQLRITDKGRGVLTTGREGPRTRIGSRQRTALEAMQRLGDWVDQSALVERGASSASVHRIVELGWATRRVRGVDRVPRDLKTADLARSEVSRLSLTAEQAQAVEGLGARLEAGRFHVALLHGVTGSGKTEIYLRLAAKAQQSDRQVLVLVPEIGLTPAAAAAFRQVFGARVAIQHSGLSVGERHDQWHRIRDGKVDVVVGTRSAVFAPLTRVGLLIVDEEHDASFKQDEAPRYHGRDVAIMRGKQANALVVLGSATPSLESYRQAKRHRYELVRLTHRPLGQTLPSVRVVDMRTEFASRGPEAVLSRPLEAAIQDRIERREQVLVLLNRRGFAAAVLCRGCGNSAECPNCSVALTVHRASHRMRCHYCGYASSVPERCAACGGSYLEWDRSGHGAGRGGSATERADGDGGADGPGHDASAWRGSDLAESVRAPRDRHPGRNPDDCQGP